MFVRELASFDFAFQACSQSARLGKCKAKRCGSRHELGAWFVSQDDRRKTTTASRRCLAGLAVPISISALGEPVAICAVAIVLILATVVCWAITDEQRSTRLTALVSAWRDAPRRRRKAKPSELPAAAPRRRKPKPL
jgi:hypothetical protein